MDSYDDAWDDAAYYAHLNEKVEGWFEKLRGYDEAYYEREEDVVRALKRALEEREERSGGREGVSPGGGGE